MIAPSIESLAKAVRKIHLQDVPQAASFLADSLRRSIGLSKPPIDPFMCARSIGVQVRFDSIEADGAYIVDDAEKPAILLRKIGDSVAATRRINFTLAHELGHHILREEITGVFGTWPFGNHNEDEERFCNSFAAELLMPTVAFRSELIDKEIVPSRLLSLATKYEVSLRACLVRVLGMSNRIVAALIWDDSFDQPVLGWATPKRFATAEFSGAVDSLISRALKNLGDVRSSLSVNVDGENRRYRAISHAMPSKQRVLTLFVRGGTTGNFSAAEVHQSPLREFRRLQVQATLPF